MMKPRFKRMDLARIVHCPLFPHLCGELTMIVDVRKSEAYLDPVEYLSTTIVGTNVLVFSDYHLGPVTYDGNAKSNWDARFETRLSDDDIWKPAENIYIIGDVMQYVRNGVITRARISSNQQF